MSDLTLDQAERYIRTWEARRIELASALDLADSSLRKLQAIDRTNLAAGAEFAGEAYLAVLRLALVEARDKTEHYKTKAGRLFAEQQAAEAAR